MLPHRVCHTLCDTQVVTQLSCSTGFRLSLRIPVHTRFARKVPPSSFIIPRHAVGLSVCVNTVKLCSLLFHLLFEPTFRILFSCSPSPPRTQSSGCHIITHSPTACHASHSSLLSACTCAPITSLSPASSAAEPPPPPPPASLRCPPAACPDAAASCSNAVFAKGKG